ncbi:NAD(P)/FAD-dependent oxidoreductase [Aestuariivirga sp.]|uniref:NAD(P)/FAD-dependent oxidoreductase n=1 Tax=Aestuariivirga sp. TaxID=2650926 RepID=UPI0039E40FE4
MSLDRPLRKIQVSKVCRPKLCQERGGLAKRCGDLKGETLAKRVIVAGSGVIGASIAYRLASRGATVTVLDAAAEAGGLATRASWGWINASWGNPEPYYRLRVRSMVEWDRLARDISGIPFQRCGGLIWDLEPEALDAFAREQASWGYDLSPLAREAILKYEPNLKVVPDRAYFAPSEGVAEPLGTAKALLAAACDLGATVVCNTPVADLLIESGRVAGVILAGGGIARSDEVVVAAGVKSPDILKRAGISLKITAPAGLLAHSKPLPKLLNGLVMTPGLHVRQTGEGRLVAGTDFAGAEPEDRPVDMAHALIAGMRALVRGAEGVELDFHTIGYRPTPADGFSAIGRPRQTQGLYAAVTHSGITLAPAIGLFAAQEILDGRRDPLLLPFSPDRPEIT